MAVQFDISKKVVPEASKVAQRTHYSAHSPLNMDTERKNVSTKEINNAGTYSSYGDELPQSCNFSVVSMSVNGGCLTWRSQYISRRLRVPEP
jgi:hypothetical protein